MASLYQTLYKVKLSQIRMLHKRGYDISKEKPLLNYSFAEFKKYYLTIEKETGETIFSLLSRLYEKKGTYLYVYYSSDIESSTGKSQISEIINFLNTKQESYPGLENAIIISKKNLSPEGRSLLAKVPLFFIQTFLYSELSWNKTAHVLVDPHTLLSKEEVENFLAENPLVKLEKMPLMVDSDPMAKYLGARPGDVVKITRRINFYVSSVDRVVTYRLVKATAEVLGL